MEAKVTMVCSFMTTTSFPFGCENFKLGHEKKERRERRGRERGKEIGKEGGRGEEKESWAGRITH